MKDQTRNLNPTAEAIIAMNLWGATYAEQRGGAMDFWDGLNAPAQQMCIEIAERVREADRHHAIAHQ